MFELTNVQNPGVKIATAQWTPPEKVGDLLPDGADHVFLGRDALCRPVAFGGKGHVMVVGAPRSGKGSCIEIPTMIRRHPKASLWSFSTRPDVATVVGPARGPGIPGVCDGAGQRVAIADSGNICDVPDSLRIRPNILMGMLDPDDPECVAASARLATAIMPLPNGGEQYFVKDGIPCLQSLALHSRTAPIYEGRRSLMTVHELAMNGDLQTWRHLRNRGRIDNETPHDVLWESMRQNTFFHGKIVREGNYYGDLVDVAEKQWKGVQGEIHARLAFLDDEGMRNTLCGDDDFQMSWLKTDPNGVSFFNVLRDDRMETDFACPRLFYEWFAWEMKRIPGPSASGHSVLAWIDEFASLKRMDSVQHGMAQLAGNHVRLAITLHTIGQMSAIYSRDGASVFKSGCPCQVFLDLGHDDDTAAYVQKTCGDVEIITHDRSHSETRGTTDSVTDGRSLQFNYGLSDGTSDGQSEQRGTSGNVGGTSGTHEGYSSGHGFGGSLFNLIRPLCFRPDWKTNTGYSAGVNDQKNWGSGWNHGITDQHGRSHQVNSGVSVGASTSVTRGSSFSVTEGWTEHRHKRPLIAINDALNEFVRITDPADPRFPGLALVKIPGHGPMVVRREDYFNSSLCYRKFARDPEYPFTQAPKPQELIDREENVRRVICEEGDRRRLVQAIERARVEVFLPYSKVTPFVPAGDKLTFPFAENLRRDRGSVLKEGEPLIASLQLRSVLQSPIDCVPEAVRWNVRDPAGGDEFGVLCVLRPAWASDLELELTSRMKLNGQRLDLALKTLLGEYADQSDGPLTGYSRAMADLAITEKCLPYSDWVEGVKYCGPLLSGGGAAILFAAGHWVVGLALGWAFVQTLKYCAEHAYDLRQIAEARRRVAVFLREDAP